MNIIYILVAMVIVVAIFTVTLHVYKFFINRKDPNYKKTMIHFWMIKISDRGI